LFLLCLLRQEHPISKDVQIKSAVADFPAATLIAMMYATTYLKFARQDLNGPIDHKFLACRLPRIQTSPNFLDSPDPNQQGKPDFINI
jgi:hypothetical protein